MLEFKPTHVHMKTCGHYELIGTAIREVDGVEMAVYRNADNVWWVRPASEFFDGRFQSTHFFDKVASNIMPDEASEENKQDDVDLEAYNLTKG